MFVGVVKHIFTIPFFTIDHCFFWQQFDWSAFNLKTRNPILSREDFYKKAKDLNLY